MNQSGVETRETAWDWAHTAYQRRVDGEAKRQLRVTDDPYEKNKTRASQSTPDNPRSQGQEQQVERKLSGLEGDTA